MWLPSVRQNIAVFSPYTNARRAVNPSGARYTWLEQDIFEEQFTARSVSGPHHRLSPPTSLDWVIAPCVSTPFPPQIRGYSYRLSFRCPAPCLLQVLSCTRWSCGRDVVGAGSKRPARSLGDATIGAWTGLYALSINITLAYRRVSIPVAFNVQTFCPHTRLTSFGLKRTISVSVENASALNSLGRLWFPRASWSNTERRCSECLAP